MNHRAKGEMHLLHFYFPPRYILRHSHPLKLSDSSGILDPGQKGADSVIISWRMWASSVLPSPDLIYDHKKTDTTKKLTLPVFQRFRTHTILYSLEWVNKIFFSKYTLLSHHSHSTDYRIFYLHKKKGHIFECEIRFPCRIDLDNYGYSFVSHRSESGGLI